MNKNYFLLIVLLLFAWKAMFAQQVQFTLKYHESDQTYGVYGKADFTKSKFFVGGGSQLSVVLPTDLIDYPLDIQTIAGGPWTDNSQIYAPSNDASSDYHGIATNGSFMSIEEGKEVLLFTFQLPKLMDSSVIRLFENEVDPSSKTAGMKGADFGNYFANALTLENVYGGNYEERVPTIQNQEVDATPAITGFELFQNTPNPFKNSTTLSYQLPADSPVKFTFTDEIGRTLFVAREQGKTGRNHFDFKKEDFQSGLIHVQMYTRFGSKSRTMLVVK